MCIVSWLKCSSTLLWPDTKLSGCFHWVGTTLCHQRGVDSLASLASTALCQIVRHFLHSFIWECVTLMHYDLHLKGSRYKKNQSSVWIINAARKWRNNVFSLTPFSPLWCLFGFNFTRTALDFRFEILLNREITSSLTFMGLITCCSLFAFSLTPRNTQGDMISTMEDQEGEKWWVTRNSPGFIPTLSMPLPLCPARPSRPPFIYSFIQVISLSWSFCYLLTAFNGIHALLLSLRNDPELDWVGWIPRWAQFCQHACDTEVNFTYTFVLFTLAVCVCVCSVYYYHYGAWCFD